MAALQAGPMQTVVAIDEDTALVIDASSGRTKVVGAGRIAWVTKGDDDQFGIRFEPRG